MPAFESTMKVLVMIDTYLLNALTACNHSLLCVTVRESDQRSEKFVCKASAVCDTVMTCSHTNGSVPSVRHPRIHAARTASDNSFTIAVRNAWDSSVNAQVTPLRSTARCCPTRVRKPTATIAVGEGRFQAHRRACRPGRKRLSQLGGAPPAERTKELEGVTK